MVKSINTRDLIAKKLRSRIFHLKVVQSKKLYNRKKEKLYTLNAAAQKGEIL